MSDYKYTNLAEIPSIKDKAADGFIVNGVCPKKRILNVWMHF